MTSKEAHDLVQECLKTNITVSEMAKELGVDNHTICKFDLYGIGIDPNDYEKALNKLKDKHQQLQTLRHRRMELMFKRIDLGLTDSEVAKAMKMETYKFQCLEMSPQYQPTAKEISEFEKALETLSSK